MRILIASPYFPPQDTVASLRVHSFASRWAAAGEEVTVLTTRKREDQGSLHLPGNGFKTVEIPFPCPRPLEVLRRADRSEPVEAGAPARRRPLFRALAALRSRTGVYSSVRMPDLTDAWVAPAIDWARRQPRWDIVVSSSGPYTAHLVALGLKSSGAARAWAADFRDLWTGNHVGRGLFPFTMRERALERRCLAEADVISTVSPPLAQRLTEAAGKPVETIYNGYLETEPEGLDAARYFSESDPESKPGHVNIVYTGTLYTSGQNPSPLLDAFARVRADRPDLADRLRLVVAGGQSAPWLEAARRYGTTDLLDLRGQLERGDVGRMQRDADVLLALAWPHAREGVLSTKLFEYLRWTAPIFVVGGAADDPIGRLVEEAGRGVHFRDDVGRLADALRRLAEGGTMPTRPRATEIIGEYSRERQADRLLDVLRGLESGNGAMRKDREPLPGRLVRATVRR